MFRTYQCITRKQCNIIYKAFMQGKLEVPCDARGKQMKPGYVYRFEDCGWFLDVSGHKDYYLANVQLDTISEVVGLICAGEYEKAQAELNGTGEKVSAELARIGLTAGKLWKRVG